jgi:hypothetical protein
MTIFPKISDWFWKVGKGKIVTGALMTNMQLLKFLCNSSVSQTSQIEIVYALPSVTMVLSSC